jgi:hypothetical protein
MADLDLPSSQGIENIAESNIPAAELLIIGDGAVGDASSLQSSFKKFRDQKIREKNLMKACRDAALSGGRAAEYKEALRHKFIETAKKYIGVPYGIKYKKEDEPVAPLYLDCCGLVRQVVQDLQEEFGFVIGKWNQAYQMDTLPIVVSEAELKPGDLIFYEGLYNSNRSKSQKHNNVHVEIFLGGETGMSRFQFPCFRIHFSDNCVGDCRRRHDWIALPQRPRFHLPFVQVHEHDVEPCEAPLPQPGHLAGRRLQVALRGAPLAQRRAQLPRGRRQALYLLRPLRGPGLQRWR